MPHSDRSIRELLDDLPEEFRQTAQTLNCEAASLSRIYPPDAARPSAIEPAGGTDPVDGVEGALLSRAPWWRAGAAVAAVGLMILAAVPSIGPSNRVRRSSDLATIRSRPEPAGVEASPSSFGTDVDSSSPKATGRSVGHAVESIRFDDPLLRMSDPELEGTLDWLEQQSGTRVRIGL